MRNCWYVAAWSDEVGDQTFARRILGDSVLMFRRGDGTAVALSNRCPHRFAPLNLGKLSHDTIQCPYHGLVFDAAGRCVANPQAGGATPAAARLHRYPLVERYGALWIWPGEPDLAATVPLPDLPFLSDERFVRIHGYLHTKANYELMTDNIMDLGHVDFLHPTSLGCEATAKAKTTVRQEGTTVFCDRWMPNDRQGPLVNYLFERDYPVDTWLDVRWEPASVMVLTMGMTDVGQPREAGRETLNAHMMTPETETSTHYFWAGCRDFRTDEPELTAQMQAGVAAAFTLEDGPMIEAQQAMMGTPDLWSLKPVLLQSDAAPVMARRILARLIAGESETHAPAGAGVTDKPALVPAE